MLVFIEEYELTPTQFGRVGAGANSSHVKEQIRGHTKCRGASVGPKLRIDRAESGPVASETV